VPSAPLPRRPFICSVPIHKGMLILYLDILEQLNPLSKCFLNFTEKVIHLPQIPFLACFVFCLNDAGQLEIKLLISVWI